MTREEAINIIRKEYLCVDRDCDIERNCGKCDLMMPSKKPILEAYKMAIKALEQVSPASPKGKWIDEINKWLDPDIDNELALERIRNIVYGADKRGDSNG